MNQDKELLYKYHTETFKSADERLDYIMDILVLAGSSIGMLRQVYYILEGLDSKYNSYFNKDRKKIDRYLRAIRERVLGDEYNALLKRYKNTRSVSDDLILFEQNLWYNLKNVFKLMSNNLVDSQILPKPEEVEKDPLENLSEEERQLMLGIKTAQ